MTFVIESLPSATPANDTVFICGTFNKWVPNDPKYALHRQLNGQLAVTITGVQGKHEFKFTRGSWTKVETSHENRYTDNRSLFFKNNLTRYISIENWLDLGGAKELNYFIFYFFACAFLGMAICFLVYRIPKKDPVKVRAFVLMNVVLTTLLIMVVLHETANQIWQSYFTFVFHISFFVMAPLVMFFLDVFTSGHLPPKRLVYVIPAMMAFAFVVIRILNLQAMSFLSDQMLPNLTWANGIMIVTGFLFNFTLFLGMLKRYHFLKMDMALASGDKGKFLLAFYATAMLALLLVPVNLALIVSGFSTPFIIDFHLVAVAFSFLIFIQAYFLWKYPEIVREGKQAAVPLDNQSDWTARLNEVMLREKPFRNVDLTVSDLAELLGTKPHVLSRVINDSYQKNFRDFVNTYRIEEFIELANRKEYKHYTFLAIAQEVGFNSKSTFNLAFKKMTRKSPREYFKNRE